MTKSSEIWKDIKDYESLYQISNHGRVKSLSRQITSHNKGYTRKERIRKPFDTKGYYSVTLHKNSKRKTFLVHRLVAQAFISNPENKPEVNHKDGDKKNNHIENLEWSTSSENIIHAIKTKLVTRESLLQKGLIGAEKISIPVLCVDTNKIFKSITEVSKKMNLICGTIANSANYKKRSHNGRGFLFQYIDKKHYNDYVGKVYEDAKEIEDEINKRIKNQGTLVKIKCLETDEVFNSYSETARNFGFHYSAIQYAVKENRKCKGYTFIKI